MSIAIEKQAAVTGAAKALLVFAPGPQAAAVPVRIIARQVEKPTAKRLGVAGPVAIDERSLAHLESVVVPLIDRSIEPLGLTPRPCELSLANLSAASARELGSRVGGFSLDLPVCMALLSAQLQLPLPQDVAFTGCLASTDGDIRHVANLPAKLDACIADPGIQRVVHPALDCDASLAALTPAAREQLEEALCRADLEVQTIPVSNIAEVLPATLTLFRQHALMFFEN